MCFVVEKSSFAIHVSSGKTAFVLVTLFLVSYPRQIMPGPQNVSKYESSLPQAKYSTAVKRKLKFLADPMILARTPTGVQGDVQCKVLAAISTVR